LVYETAGITVFWGLAPWPDYSRGNMGDGQEVQDQKGNPGFNAFLTTGSGKPVMLESFLDNWGFIPSILLYYHTIMLS